MTGGAVQAAPHSVNTQKHGGTRRRKGMTQVLLPTDKAGSMNQCAGVGALPGVPSAPSRRQAKLKRRRHVVRNTFVQPRQ